MKQIAHFIWILITIVEYIILYDMPYNDSYLLVASNIAIFNIILFFILIVKTDGQIVSFFSAFIIFLYLFHFGEIFCAAYHPELKMDFMSYVLHYMTNGQIAKRTIEICLTCINCLCIGGFYRKQKNDQPTIDTSETYDPYFLYSLCKYLFWITLPINIWLNMRIIGAAMVGGYTATNHMESVPGIFTTFSNFWYIAFPFYYVLSPKSDQKYILYPCLAYIAFTMLTGNRGHQIVNLLSFFILIYYAHEIKINVKNTLITTLFVFIGLVILDVIFANRGYGIIYILSNFNDLFSKSLENNIIISTLYNFGATIFTPYLTVNELTYDIHPFFFESYIKSLSSIIPNVGGFLTDLYREGKFTNQLNTSHAIGGSFIAELYYNCGNMYIIVAVIFGYYYEKISSNFINSIKSGNWTSIFIIYTFGSLSMWWVRDSFFNLIRILVWAWLIYSVSYNLYKQRNDIW